VPPAWIVEPIDVLEYCSSCLPASFPFLTPDQFGFQRFKECFDHGFVHCPSVVCLQTMRGVTISLAAHRNKKAMLLETFLIVARTVLRPAIGMVDAPLWWSAQCHGHNAYTRLKERRPVAGFRAHG